MYLVLLNLDYLDCKRQNQLALDRLKGVEDSLSPTHTCFPHGGSSSVRGPDYADIWPVWLYSPAEFTFLTVSVTEAIKQLQASNNY